MSKRSVDDGSDEDAPAAKEVKQGEDVLCAFRVLSDAGFFKGDDVAVTAFNFCVKKKLPDAAEYLANMHNATVHGYGAHIDPLDGEMADWITEYLFVAVERRRESPFSLWIGSEDDVVSRLVDFFVQRKWWEAYTSMVYAVRHVYLDSGVSILGNPLPILQEALKADWGRSQKEIDEVQEQIDSWCY